MKAKKLIFLLLLVPTLCLAYCNSSVDSDLTLDSDVNATGNATCFTITADDVTLDCAGHEVYSNSAGVGVYAANVERFTLKNCVLSNFSSGVSLGSANYSTLFNNTVFNSSSYGVKVTGYSKHLNFSSNNVSYPDDHGYYFTNAEAFNLSFSNNLVYAAGRFPTSSPQYWSRGFRAQSTESANVSYSTFYGNNVSYVGAHSFRVDAGYNNYSYNYIGYNSRRPNYAGYAGVFTAGANTTIEHNEFNAVDYGVDLREGANNTRVAYNTFSSCMNYAFQANSNVSHARVYNNTFVNGTGSGAVWAIGPHANVSYNAILDSSGWPDDDYFSSLTNVFTQSYELISIWSEPGVGPNSAWVAFNTISGINASYSNIIGIMAGYSGWGYPGDGGTIFNNTIQNTTSHAIKFSIGNNSNVSYNRIEGAGGAAVYFENANNDSVIHDNYLSGDACIELDHSTENNTFFNNSLYGGTDYFVNNSGSNRFNNSAGQGNYYEGVLEYQIYDSDSDGYGDSGADYPYDSTLNGWIGEGADYGPKGATTTGYFAAFSSTPESGRVMNAGDSIELAGYCESNVTATGARFWLFKNGAPYLTISNSSAVSNATRFTASFDSLIEVMDLEWWLECTRHSYNSNSTSRTLLVRASGGSSTGSTAQKEEPNEEATVAGQEQEEEAQTEEPDEPKEEAAKGESPAKRLIDSAVSERKTVSLSGGEQGGAESVDFEVWRELSVYEESPEKRRYSRITLYFRNNGGAPLTQVIVKEHLPEEVAESPDDLTDFSLEPYAFEEGSVIVTWKFDSIQPGEVKSVSYEVGGGLRPDLMEDFEPPAITSLDTRRIVYELTRMPLHAILLALLLTGLFIIMEDYF